MKKLFIESHQFTDDVQRLLDEETYTAFQNQLLAQPDKEEPCRAVADYERFA
jgi:hypothetical protein